MLLLLCMLALPLGAVDVVGETGEVGGVGAESPSDDHLFRLQRGGCPMFWYRFNGRCYKYIATRMTWADAELHCLSQGANLVSIQTAEVQSFINAMIKSFDPAEGLTWIGLSDSHKEGHWMWSDGCPARVFFWKAGEPNNLENEDCGHTSYGTQREWNDVPCSRTYPSVCATRINCV